jgi:hypothetical protein
MTIEALAEMRRNPDEGGETARAADCLCARKLFLVRARARVAVVPTDVVAGRLASTR